MVVRMRLYVGDIVIESEKTTNSWTFTEFRKSKSSRSEDVRVGSERKLEVRNQVDSIFPNHKCVVCLQPRRGAVAGEAGQSTRAVT